MNKIIVFGENHHNTLGLIRSLGAAGLFCDLIVVDKSKVEPYIIRSKFVKSHIIVADVTEGLEYLRKMYEYEKDKPVIFPTYDTEAKILDEYYNELSLKYILPSIDGKQGQISVNMNKEFMRKKAERYGLKTPYSFVIDCRELILIPDDIIYPCVIKGIDSASAPKDTNIYFNEEELKTGLQKLSSICSIIQVQEYINKDSEIMVLGCSVKERGINCCCVIDKIRQFPIGIGGTAFALVSPDIEKYIDKDILDEYLKSLNYTGLFSVEFIISNGIPYFLEINFRNDGNGYVPVYGNVNLATQLYYGLTTNKKIENIRISKSYYMQSEFYDIGNVKNKTMSFLDFLRDMLRSKVLLYWNKKDPKPYFDLIFKSLKGKFI